jgi:hypothetical protein
LANTADAVVALVGTCTGGLTCTVGYSGIITR